VKPAPRRAGAAWPAKFGASPPGLRRGEREDSAVSVIGTQASGVPVAEAEAKPCRG